MLKILSFLVHRKHEAKLVHLCCGCLYHYIKTSSPLMLSCSRNKQVLLSILSSHTKAENPHFSISFIDFNSITENAAALLTYEPNGKSWKNLLSDVSEVVPDRIRPYRRAPSLKLEGVLELLKEFKRECEGGGVKRRHVESLWGIFSLTKDHGLIRSPEFCELMTSILLRYGMLREVQLVHMAAEEQGVQVDSRIIFCGLIEGYVDASDADRALLVYQQMKERSLKPSTLCYRILIDILVSNERTTVAYPICMDMFEQGIALNVAEKTVVEKVARLLCRDGMIQEARNLTRQIMNSGREPSDLILNEIICGYCEKRDFDDIIRLLVESRCSLSVISGNKIISTLCSNGGVEKANLFRLEMEKNGFISDEITFGILIGWSCKEGKIKCALTYLSELLSRGLKPDIWSYNSLLCAVFSKNLWQHARPIFDEALESGISPNSTTFKVLLAGYCKARQFEIVKLIVPVMEKLGFVESFVRDPLSVAFSFLGMNPLSVSMKRDNSVGLWKMEFYDSLGNGLYLDTDVDEFDKVVNTIIEDSYFPNFNLLIERECVNENFQAYFLFIDQMHRWGQEISLNVFLPLLKGCVTSQDYTYLCFDLIEKMPKLLSQFDDDTHNFLIKLYCKKGLIHKARILFYSMLQRQSLISNDAHAALLIGFSRRGSKGEVIEVWNNAQYFQWTPKLRYFRALTECFCHREMLREAVDVFKMLLIFEASNWKEICNVFVEVVSINGYSHAAHVLEENLRQHGLLLDDSAYNHLLRAFCKGKKQLFAQKLLEFMLNMNIIPSLETSLALIPLLCRAGEHQKALYLKKFYPTEPCISVIHNALIHGFYLTGRNGAIDIFHYMCSKRLCPDNRTFNLTFSTFCKEKNVRKVNEFLGFMTRNNIPLSIPSYRNLVKFMCSKGRFTYPLRFLELMNFDNIILVNILIYNLFLEGNRPLVNDLLNSLREKGLFPNESTCNFLILGFSKCGDANTCEALFDEMVALGFKPNYQSINRMATVLCASEEHEKIRKMIHQMEANEWIHFTSFQNKIVEFFLLSSKISEAERFLTRIAEKGLITDKINYGFLIKQFCLYGRYGKAMDLLNIMLKKGSKPDAESYDSIIQTLCSFNKMNHALDLQAEMLDMEMRPSVDTWNMLVSKLCQHGRTAEAEEILRCFTRLGGTPTRQMYSNVIERYRIENDVRRASEVIREMQGRGYDPDFDMHWSLINKMNYGKNIKGLVSRLLFGNDKHPKG